MEKESKCSKDRPDGIFYDINPLKKLIHNGGMMNIFRTIGCIGDSLSSGEFEYDMGEGAKGYWDCYEYSWGKQIERITGIEITNFSHGGLTAHYLYDSADKKNNGNVDINRLFDFDNLKQAYIIALGVNDLKGENVLEEQYGGEIGRADKDIDLQDYHNNPQTFVGDYARIIQRLQSMQPDTKFFLVTMPKIAEEAPLEEEFARTIYGIAKKLSNCYVIDLYQYGPIYDTRFRKQYFHGHMNAMGYLYTANLIMTYIDWIIRTRLSEFQFIQFTGTKYHPVIKNMSGKTLYAFGDSIMAGHYGEKRSLPDIIAETEHMELLKFAVNEATILPSEKWIQKQIEEAPKKRPDYLLFDGGMNDAYYFGNRKAGKREESCLEDFTVFMNKLIKTMRRKWPRTNLVYVAVHRMEELDGDIQEKLYMIEMDICRKWDVTVADLYGKSTSGLYSSLSAVEKCYVPLITEALQECEPIL